MRKIFLLLYIVIDLFSKICSQPSPKNFISNLYYSSKDNQYYIQIYLGENPIPQRYIIDTTYSTTSSPCNLCQTCSNHYFPFFIAEDENNFNFINNNCTKENQCINSIEHVFNKDKNIDFIFLNTKIFINDTYNNNDNEDDDDYSESLIFSADIGCTIKEGNFYENKDVNGIMGLNNGEIAFVDELYNLNIIDKNLFSIFITKNKEKDNNNNNKKGIISFGDITIKNNTINYIKIMPSNDNLFQLKTNYFKINNNNINSEYLSIIDTSADFTYFPNNLYEQIINLLLSDHNLLEDNDNGYCAIINKNNENDFYDKFNDILINFGDYNFMWKSKNYFVKYNSEKDFEIKLCLGFKKFDTFFKNTDNDDNRIILGINFMMEYEIIFDKSNQKIGFINTENEKLDLVDISHSEQINDSERIIKENENQIDYNLSYEIITNTSIDETNDYSNDIEYINTNIIISKVISSKNVNNNLSITIQENLSDTSYYLFNNSNDKLIISDNYSEIIIKEDREEKNIIISELSTNYLINDTSANIKLSDNNNESDYFSDINEYLENNDYNQEGNNTIQFNNARNTIKDYIDSNSNIFINKTNSLSTQDYIKIGSSEINIDSTEINIDSTEIKIDSTEKVVDTTQKIDIIEPKIDTTEIIDTTEYEKKIETTIITEIIITNAKEEILNNINNKENNIKETELNNDNNNDENYKNNTQIINQGNTKNTFYEVIKSFLKNKLIYFFVAFIGLILIFVSIIFVSCAFLSCIKYIKRKIKGKNYMEQMDIELPKYSKDNNIYSYTEGSN